MTWGFHAMLNLARCKGSTIRCPKHIDNFTKTLVKRIDMKAYGQPQIVRFGEGNKMGYTLVQLIETSNITGHFCEETNDAYLDVFSCKPFQMETVVATAKEYFEPEDFNMSYVERQAPVSRKYE
jgi:S-adenosylmethionine/arginine decarboxylase-like enzyme